MGKKSHGKLSITRKEAQVHLTINGRPPRAFKSHFQQYSTVNERPNKAAMENSETKVMCEDAGSEDC